MLKYEFKFWWEIARGGLVAAAVVILTKITNMDGVTDWRTWVTGLGTAVAVAFASGALAALTAKQGVD